MENFIKNNTLIFTTICPVIKTDEQGETTKDYKPKVTGWKTMTHEQCLKKADSNDTHFLIKCNNNFIVFDTDTRAEYGKLISILKELSLIKSVSSTKSTRGDEYSYKRHFWFSVDDVKFSDMKKHYFALNNRMYCEYFKLNKIIIDYILNNIKDKKISEIIQYQYRPLDRPGMEQRNENERLVKLFWSPEC